MSADTFFFYNTQDHSLVNINADDTMVSECTLKNLEDQNLPNDVPSDLALKSSLEGGEKLPCDF